MVSCNSKQLSNKEKATVIFKERLSKKYEQVVIDEIKIISIDINPFIVSNVDHTTDPYLVKMAKLIQDAGQQAYVNKELASIWGEKKYLKLFEKNAALHDSLCLETQKYIKSFPSHLAFYEIEIEYLRIGKTESEKDYFNADTTLTKEIEINIDLLNHKIYDGLGPFAYTIFRK